MRDTFHVAAGDVSSRRAFLRLEMGVVSSDVEDDIVSNVIRFSFFTGDEDSCIVP